jgi:ABC-type multidrug transport system ATPase subunit
MSAVFEIKDLSIWYGPKASKAIDSLSINFNENSVNIILGQNGSGKSSLLRCLAGLQHWQEGDIVRFGLSRSYERPDFNADQILISEDLNLQYLSLSEYAEAYSEIWPKFDFETFRRILAWGEVSERKTYGQLSRGQKILGQFALGLATQCKIILIDEVTAALDPYVRAKVADELLRYKENLKATIVFATNIATEFNHFDPNVFLLKNGKLYLQGLLSEIRNEFVKVVVKRDELDSYESKGFVLLYTLLSGDVCLIGRNNSSESVKSIKSADTITLEEIFVFLSHRGVS